MVSFGMPDTEYYGLMIGYTRPAALRETDLEGSVFFMGEYIGTYRIVMTFTTPKAEESHG